MDIDLILASNSPRRRDFLHNMGLKFTIMAPNIDENPFSGEDPKSYVMRMANTKAQAIASEHLNTLVLAADTIVVCEGRIIGKPKNREDAFNIIKFLSNKTHEVMSAVTLVKGQIKKEIFVATKVSFANLDDDLIRTYVATGECDDKSGAYAVQGIGAMLVKEVSGSVSSVVGLPVCQVREALKEFNIFPRSSIAN